MSQNDGMTSEIPLPVHRTIGSLVAVWALALAGSIVAGVVSPPESRFAWISIVLAACVALTFVLQLLTHEKHGFILRIAGSISGAVLIAAIVSGVVGLFTAFGG